MRLHNVEEAILKFEPINQDHALSTPVSQGVDYALLKDLVLDHINSLQKINLKLGASVDIAERLGELKAAYETIFGGPVVDNINEGYADNVSAVANEIIKRSQSTPFTKEELLTAIESEARSANVPELKFKDSKSKAWPDFVKDVLAAVKGQVKFSRPGVAASAAERKAKSEQMLDKIARIIEDSIGYTFPDGDPVDYIIPRVERLGINTYDIGELLDKVARKKLGAKSLDAYMGDVYDDLLADNPMVAVQSGITHNPYTHKLVDLAGSLHGFMLSEPFMFVDILSHDVTIEDPKIIAATEANKEDAIHALLRVIKSQPDYHGIKRAVRNLINGGLDWPELAVMQKSIEPAKIAEDVINPGDVLMVEGNTEAVVGTILSVDNDTIIIEGASYPLTEAEYHGREVQLGKPMAGDVKKYKVYVKDPKTGNVKKVNFGDKGMEIKRDNPERRKSFRARHGCGTPRASDRTKAAYWSCRMWSSKPVSKILKGK
jgi:hypothetical protein